MVHNLAENNPLLGQFVAELRSIDIQTDRMRFRRNLERIGEICAYEIARHLPTKTIDVTTPLGIAECLVLEKQPVLATILRAGLPLHQGLLNYFDQADNAFISAYRKHHKSGDFTIQLEYLSCPDLGERVIILSDPMLATGSSMVVTLDELHLQGAPLQVHLVVVIACRQGIAYVKQHYPNITIWCATIDDELTAKGYIVPGLGDAGDLAFGTKVQD